MESNQNKFKIYAPTWNDGLELPILLQIFKIILDISLKKHEVFTNILPMKI